MKFTVYVLYQGVRGEFDVDEQAHYDAQMEGARQFLEEHPSDRPHDDRRRPYPIPVRPSWLVTGGFVHSKRAVDRRVKY